MIGIAETVHRLGKQEGEHRLVTWLQELTAAALGRPAARVAVDRPLTEQGLDSLSAVELSHAVETGLGLELSMDRLLEGPSLAEVAAELWARRHTAPIVEEPTPGEGALSRAMGASRGEDHPTSVLSGDFPLTWGQRALWFLDRLAPGNTAYVIGGAARVLGRLDAVALVRALHRLGERHPALRATFHAGDPEPLQRVHEVPLVELVEEDDSGWDEAESAERLRALAYRPFDLATGPLLRVVLVQRGGAVGLVALAVHHVIADFWSLGVVVRELGALYAEERGERGSERLAPAPRRGPGEVARRQAERLAGPQVERLWEPWRRELAGFPTVLELPADRPRPAAQTWGGAARHLRLDGAVSAAVESLARDQGATPYMVLLAAFGALLGRFAGQRKLLVGTPTAGRGPGDGELVGYFVNPLPIAVDLSAAAAEPLRFEGLVARVRGRALAAFAGQEMPFPLLAERLAPEREVARSPVFQVMFALQKERPGEEGLGGFATGMQVRLSLGGLELESVPLAPAGSPFDLSLTLAPLSNTAGGMAGRLVYNPDLFDGVTMERLAGQLEVLVRAAVARPGTAVAGLPLLGPGERQQVVVEWNDGAPAAGEANWLEEMWPALVAHDPGRVVAVCEGAERTRGELEERANRVANRLLALGAGPDRLVAVLLERSLELLDGLLGVLKSGAGYLPLDPELPDERIAQLLAEARPVVLLTQESLRRRAPFDGPVVCLASDGEAFAEWSPEPPAVAQLPEALAYVLYTSGSTGAPKGVGVSRRAMDNLIRVRAEDFGERYWTLQRASVGFDVSVIELFVPLATGGRVVLVPPGGQRDLSSLVRMLAAERVVATGFPPALLEEVVQREELGNCRELRRLVSGMDVLPPDLVGRISDRLPECGLFNCYGPTEATVYVLEHRCGRDEPGPRVPIGRPVGGAEIHLLDADLEVVPPGVAGELCIGGVCLARGYLGRPDRTAERFVPHPLAAGARLYRTGDLARRRADGEIEFLGRIDRQVKVRGHRVEPGEIEAALCQHPAVLQAAVVVRSGEAPADRRLEACVVAADGQELSASTLARHLATRLPLYMVPSGFVFLSELPLLGNGKPDHQALLRLAPADPLRGLVAERRVPFEAPSTPIEQTLIEIWVEVLKATPDRIGIHDDFFDLGGNSLQVTQVLLRVEERLGIELPVRRLYEAPTVADLAVALAEQLLGEADEQRLTELLAGLE